MASTGFFYKPDFLLHRTGDFHPEKPERVSAIVGHLERVKLLWELTCPDFPPAAVSTVALVHRQEYVDLVKRACPEKGLFYFDADTPVSGRSYDAAMRAAGAVVAACDGVYDGKLSNAFCCVRPPGHHAETARAMGFCLFNNVAVAARHLQRKRGLERVAIVDWDVHHGNGTQNAFYSDPTVLYMSLHQFPHYPGTGSSGETGEGPGLGFTVNVPLGAGAGDADYEEVFDTVFGPRLREFKPQFILVSAGFDAHRDDPLSAMLVTHEGFGRLTKRVKTWAQELCGGRLVLALEGGYQLDALSVSVEACLRELLEG